MTAEKEYEGRCFCGAVQVRVKGAPQRSVSIKELTGDGATVIGPPVRREASGRNG